MKYIFSFLITTLCSIAFAQGSYQVAVLKYNGGGDYYANPTAVPNLVEYANQQFDANISTEVPYVDAGSPLLSSYPFIHMTGHGNVVFSNSELENLRNYLIGGGFLHIDDNYGMDQYIRPELEKLFPNLDLVEIPYDHALFNQKFKFNGLPKIHEHDDKRPQAFGIFIEGRMALLYTYESDLGDGWEDLSVHNDTQENHEKALKMGINILQFSLINGGLE
ncbi:DUF4159 domain-containing protein [Brumimicrobium aurantiacum]|uniref:DUF4159 domain-containing protein n=1 Tax=Brumimicrobium aurantiacum TaxID=1737063 RepID=A0A3E1F0E5_9FLAO|nr:DUF4159 domain-containing protein [Brumimicrobium aurantiacum]RFC55299.1 DUF4159 domain-containing protein [Brumimicrobium aurantiacum]